MSAVSDVEFVEARVGSCGCPEERYTFRGVELIIHFEPDGSVDGFLDPGDETADWITEEGVTAFNGRLAVFAWAASKFAA